jgi:hypothetical protein
MGWPLDYFVLIDRDGTSDIPQPLTIKLAQKKNRISASFPRSGYHFLHHVQTKRTP